MGKKSFKKIMATMATVILLASGCGNQQATDTSVLKVAIEKTFTTLSSHQTTTLAEMEVIAQFMEGLFGYNREGELVPLGAESYTQSADGLTYTFQLRQDVLWQNGEPVTAKDYVYSWQQLIKDGAFKHNAKMLKNGAAILAGTKQPSELGVQAQSDYTLVATLEQPDNSFVQYLSSSGFLPLHQASYEAFGGKEGYGTNATTLMTNGPFALSEYVVGSKIVLTKNPQYWDAAHVLLNKVEMTVVPELTTQKTLFDSGDIDYVRVQGELVDVYADKEKQLARPENRIMYMYLSGNTANTEVALANKNFRKAIALAIDREIITSSIMKDGAQPLYSLYPRGFMNVDGQDYRDIANVNNTNPFNPQQAQEYLNKAKQELQQETITFKFSVQDMVIYKKVFDNIKSQIEKNLSGVKMEIETLPNQIYFPEIMKFQTPAAMATWGGGTIDYYNFAQLFEKDSSYNYGKYNNPRFDEKVKQARHEIDPYKQAQYFADAENILIEDAEFIPLYQMGQTYQLSPAIQTVILQPAMPAIQYKYVEKA